MEKKYDVAVYGLWYGNNYGSIITYYALSKILEDMKLTYAMIKNPLGRNIDVSTLCRSHPLRFAEEQYDITPLYRLDELHKLNEMFDTFLIGSDQMWNYFLSQNYKQSYFFDFVRDDKNKIAYGTSFGHKGYDGPKSEQELVKKNLARFNAISVRDDFSQEMCQNLFGVDARQVFDPVFLCPVEKYDLLVEQAEIREEKGEFIFAYVLDPNPAFGDALRKIAAKHGKRIVVIYDELRYNQPHTMESLRESLGLTAEDPITILEDPNVKEWLYCFKYADLVLTDSFHGSCFSVIFQKDFLVLRNDVRGGSRFPFLLGGLGLLDRIVTSPAEMVEKFTALQEGGSFAIDYAPVHAKLEKSCAASRAWLENAIRNPGKPKAAAVPAAPKEAEIPTDVKKCQMLAALLKAYGIKHVVLSSGTRHMQLVRFFENNKCFTTHNVVDERSAGFYALGIATKLRQPVVVCCTSGTAAANYLTCMAEAYYQHVPLIFITADRFQHLLNQREEQMIPQDHMYGSVCLKSVTIPTTEGPIGMAVTRRMICETILEATHRTPGPVQINLPMGTIFNFNPPASFYDLKDVRYRRIFRHMLHPDKSSWTSALDRLKASKRVMVVYGQNHVLNSDEQKALDEFCKKFNCVICTDQLSNVTCSKSVDVFNMLRLPSKITKEMISALKPEIVITVHGANVSCIRDFVVRSGEVLHWDVALDGVAADPYKKLTRIFECNPTQFFKRMNAMAGNVTAESSYFQAWKNRMVEEDSIPEEYSQRYAVYHTLKRIPSGAMLHLANSTSVRMGSSYRLQDNIEVYCNRGTNGIDGSASAFMGQVAVSDELCFLLIGDLSFFYDMNSLWNKQLKGNIRIILFNNSCASLLKRYQCKAITYKHDDVAEGWVKSLGFTYLSSRNKEEFDANIQRFTSDEDTPMFFEVFC